ncbi:unnamed protein product [Somion occarium]|uniref:Uncharacterized protein n=1 Tax=Somion occarium TaxID=3059160 RepID=A0ABP1DF87_9APHY
MMTIDMASRSVSWERGNTPQLNSLHDVFDARHNIGPGLYNFSPIKIGKHRENVVRLRQYIGWEQRKLMKACFPQNHSKEVLLLCFSCTTLGSGFWARTVCPLTFEYAVKRPLYFKFPTLKAKLRRRRA